jgi:hypothetical protein
MQTQRTWRSEVTGIELLRTRPDGSEEPVELRDLAPGDVFRATGPGVWPEGMHPAGKQIALDSGESFFGSKELFLDSRDLAPGEDVEEVRAAIREEFKRKEEPDRSHSPVEPVSRSEFEALERRVAELESASRDPEESVLRIDLLDPPGRVLKIDVPGENAPLVMPCLPEYLTMDLQRLLLREGVEVLVEEENGSFVAPQSRVERIPLTHSGYWDEIHLQRARTQVVREPGVPDGSGNVVSREELEKAFERFRADSSRTPNEVILPVPIAGGIVYARRVGYAGTQHKGQDLSDDILQIFLERGDLIRVENPDGTHRKTATGYPLRGWVNGDEEGPILLLGEPLEERLRRDAAELGLEPCRGPSPESVKKINAFVEEAAKSDKWKRFKVEGRGNLRERLSRTLETSTRERNRCLRLVREILEKDPDSERGIEFDFDRTFVYLSAANRAEAIRVLAASTLAGLDEEKESEDE